jgi:hypothetical protein
MEQIMNIPLPDPNEENEQGIPQEMEVQISALAAQASNVLLNRNQNEIAAQQAQQAAQDPVIQMQAQELQLKQAEEQRKAQKDQADTQLKIEQMNIERERIASQERIAGAQILAKTEKDAMDLEIKRQQEMVKAVQANKPQQGIKTNG